MADSPGPIGYDWTAGGHPALPRIYGMARPSFLAPVH